MALYADFTTDELVGLRKKILEQRAKGVSAFSYNGQSFTYSSPTQMLIVAQEIQREISKRLAASQGLVPVDPFSVIVRRPLSE